MLPLGLVHSNPAIHHLGMVSMGLKKWAKNGFFCELGFAKLLHESALNPSLD